MPNPFPGMDPYLEGPLGMTVHTNLIVEIARQLVPKVMPKYLVLCGQRVVVAPPDETALSSARSPDVGTFAPDALAATNGGTATATAAPLVMEALRPEPLTHHTVEIREAAQRRLVTAIEVLSPTNKRDDGREEYAAKREELLSSSAHLIEIDLIRVGDRFPTVRPLPAVPYFVFLSRSGRRGGVEVWPIPLDQPLPVIPVPLLAGDADQALDLQAALTVAYNDFRFDVVLAADYAGPPPGPLTPEQLAWVEEGLRQAGRRPG